MTTRKELLLEKFTALESELKQYVDKSVFPSLDEIDLSDLVFYVTMTFLGMNDAASMGGKIKELIDSNNVTITEENLKKVIPLVADFVVWLRAL